MKTSLAVLLLSLLSTPLALASEVHTYEVTVTNATAAQVITPPLLVTHRPGYALFHLAAPASDGLATLAETGNNQVLYSEVNGAVGVDDAVASTTFIPFGHAASFQITARRHDRLSLVGMLATTNDGFAALDGVRLPRHAARYLAYAYDAGSEANNEQCAYVPGPPCPASSGNARDTAGAEGFVTLHSGIHGQGDLDAAKLDWRGPVAVVTVRRID